jgi:hypothetical protein
MEPNRQLWNQQHKSLTGLLTRPPGAEDPARHRRAIDLFLALHAPLHASEVSGSGGWSLDDELWDGLSEAAFRCIPPGGVDSIAWAIWHIARIEDMTMNYLIAGEPQLFEREGWRERLKAAARDTGNAMDPSAVARLSAEIDMPALHAYRAAVGRRTREIIARVEPGEFRQPVDPAQLHRMLQDGAVVPEAAGLLEYWGSKTKGSLLLMPPTRHLLVHLNEARRLKKKYKG